MRKIKKSGDVDQRSTRALRRAFPEAITVEGPVDLKAIRKLFKQQCREENEAYEKIRDDLMQHSQGEWALLVNKRLIGVYESRAEALNVGYPLVGRAGRKVVFVVRIGFEDEGKLKPDDVLQ